MYHTIFLPVSNIGLLRRRLHMSQAQLAEGICSRQSIVRFETGSAAPSESLARKLAQRLQVDPWSFVQMAKYDRKQIALMKKATLEKDCRTLQRVCSEMLARTTPKVAREHFEHCQEVCKEVAQS